MFPTSFPMFVRPVKEGLILWTDYYGYLEVWTQKENYGDLIFQFGINCPIGKSPYDLIMSNYENDNLIWQGDDE